MPKLGLILKKKFYIWEDYTLKKYEDFEELGRENEENVALTRICCGWPSNKVIGKYIKKNC